MSSSPAELPLSQPLNDTERDAVLQCFWNAQNFDTTRYKTYLDYYEDQRQELGIGALLEQSLLSRMAASTHRDIRDIATLLSKHRSLPLSEVRTKIEAEFSHHTPESIKLSIDLALRLFLTINVRGTSSDSESIVGGPPVRPWDDPAISLVRFLELQFSSTSTPLAFDDRWMRAKFTACELISICSVEIVWTECLANHLQYDDENNTLYIYHFRCCLFDHMNGSGALMQGPEFAGSIYPKELLRETIWTLILLFPAKDKATKDYLKDEKKKFHYDPPFEESRRLNLNDYKYWGETLRRLHQKYVAAEQASVQRAFFNVDNPLQLYTLWSVLFFSVVTVVFGIISSYTGFVSLKLSQESLQIAQSAWALQLSQAATATASSPASSSSSSSRASSTLTFRV